MDDQPQPQPGPSPSPFESNPNSPFGQPQAPTPNPGPSPYGQPHAPAPGPSAYGPPPPNPGSPYGQPNPGFNPYAQAPGGQPHNPYAAPISDATPGWQMGMYDHGVLASRGTRFLGALLDGMIYFLAVIPAVLIAGDFDALRAADYETTVAAAVLIPMLLVAIVQWYLIATTGQSLAKKLLGMKIIKTTGEDVNFVSGVILRSWLPTAINYIPLVGAFFPLLDALYIFGGDQECLHDKIASTKVISV